MRGIGGRLVPGPTVRLLGLCLLLGAVSLLLSSTPRFDPGAWVIWGKQITDANVELSTLRGPSWKPLPVMFTTIFSLFGAAAPTLWVLTARTGAMLALAFAYRLGERLAGTGAGVAAALFLVLTGGWLGEVGYAGEAGILLALVLAAVDRHLAGHPTQAFTLGVAAALLRVEIWPFVGLYALWLGWRRHGSRLLMASALLSLPVVWFVPDWVTIGEPFRASRVAHTSAEAHAMGALEHPALVVLARAYELVPLPVHLLALVSVAYAVRRGERAVLVLVTAALAWVALVVLMTVAGGYAGLPRFMAPAAALVCVIAAVGAAQLIETASRRVPALAATAILVAIVVPFGIPRLEAVLGHARAAHQWQQTADDLESAVDRVGGPSKVACQQPTVNYPASTRLAWILGVPLDAVDSRGRPGSLVFAASQHVGKPPPRPSGARYTKLTRVGVWTVYSIPATSRKLARANPRCPPRFAAHGR